LIALFAILFILGMNGAINAFLKRRATLVQRPIDAYAAVPALTSASIEDGRPIHISFGSAAPGLDSTPLALATADFAYYTAQRITLGDAMPLFTLTEPSGLPLAFDTMRRAYEARGPEAVERFNLMRKKRAGVRWYPAGTQSLAFAGGVTAMQSEERITTHFFLGRQGVELALMAEAAQRKGHTVVAGSDQLAGQAVAYAMADYALIGDEIFAGGAYVGQTPELLRRNRVMDGLRVSMIAVLVALAVAARLQLGGA
jgi:hypothetical protein